MRVCPGNSPCCRQQPRFVPVGPIFDDSEIQHLQIVVLVSEAGHEKIGRFDVPVHKAVFMRLGERTTRLTQEHDDALGWLRSEAFHHAVQVQTFKQLHDVIEVSAVGDSEIVKLHRMRRAQTGGYLRLALESPHELFACRAQLAALSNQLHGRRTHQEPVLGTPDLAHAAGAQWFHETVAADREPFVEELLVDLQHRAFREDESRARARSAARGCCPATRTAAAGPSTPATRRSTILLICRACFRTK